MHASGMGGAALIDILRTTRKVVVEGKLWAGIGA
jgi:hypothetical protein